MKQLSKKWNIIIEEHKEVIDYQLVYTIITLPDYFKLL